MDVGAGLLPADPAGVVRTIGHQVGVAVGTRAGEAGSGDGFAEVCGALEALLDPAGSRFRIGEEPWLPDTGPALETHRWGRPGGGSFGHVWRAIVPRFLC